MTIQVAQKLAELGAIASTKRGTGGMRIEDSLGFGGTRGQKYQQEQRYLQRVTKE